MLLAGRVIRSGKHWAIEIPILGVVSQGRTKREALEMICDAVESLANQPGFSVDVRHAEGDRFVVGSNEPATLAAFLLRRVRERSGLSLAEAAERLGASSRNAYARYEQGKAVPTITKLSELLQAVAGGDFVLSEVR
ncbi:MAG: helix-turn-helix domain-containing protein [Deltaproteobacteria bacterium]|nr:helix-turn-helix domain-containing protein [Deltaproteobacteria bacterium]